MPTKITSWSYSRWAQYEECPLKAKLKFIDKMKEPESEAMNRGAEIHKKAELFLNGTTSKLPVELVKLKEQFTKTKKNKEAKQELEMAFDKYWEPCSWSDWERCWVRIKIDLLEPPSKLGGVRVVDFKTGKFRPISYVPQLELYAIGAFSTYESATHAITQLWFTDVGIVHPEPESKDGIFYREELPKLKELWKKRTRPMLSDTKFAPRPGIYCRWCAFSKSKGGPCKF